MRVWKGWPRHPNARFSVAYVGCGRRRGTLLERSLDILEEEIVWQQRDKGDDETTRIDGEALGRQTLSLFICSTPKVRERFQDERGLKAWAGRTADEA